MRRSSITASAKAKPPSQGNKTDFARLTTTADFGAGTVNGVKVVTTGDGALVLDPSAGLLQGTDTTGIHNGGSFLYGTYVSPVYTSQAFWNWGVASWEADTPAGTWVQVELRALVNGLWTTYYNMGVWAFDTSTIQRHSVAGQSDTSGHLIVVRGFDAAGSVICNDPAASYAVGESVRIVYNRDELAHVWLTASGIAYIIYPVGHAVPGTPNGSW